MINVNVKFNKITTNLETGKPRMVHKTYYEHPMCLARKILKNTFEMLERHYRRSLTTRGNRRAHNFLSSQK